MKCPFDSCAFQSSVLSTFKAHRSRVHWSCNVDSFRAELTTRVSLSPVSELLVEDTPEPSLNVLSFSSTSDNEEDIDKSFEHRLASLFLCMQTILHVSKSAIQEIAEELGQIGSAAKEVYKKAVADILRNCNCSTDSTTVNALGDLFNKLNPLYLLSVDGFLCTTTKENHTHIILL